MWTVVATACSPAEGSLAGTWDFIATQASLGGNTSGTLTWDKSSASFQLTSTGGRDCWTDPYTGKQFCSGGSPTAAMVTVMLVEGAGTVTATIPSNGWLPSGTSMVALQRIGAPGQSAGVLPLNPFGTWMLSSKGEQVTAIMSSSALTASGYRSFRAQQLSRLDSIFGDLGGEWNFQEDRRGFTCTARFAGDTFSATWSGGSVSVTIHDRLLSGTTSNGYEISGQKR
jgi:hypothetical protein